MRERERISECVCVSVCLRERERETERERGRESGKAVRDRTGNEVDIVGGEANSSLSVTVVAQTIKNQAKSGDYRYIAIKSK